MWKEKDGMEEQERLNVKGAAQEGQEHGHMFVSAANSAWGHAAIKKHWDWLSDGACAVSLCSDFSLESPSVEFIP